MKEKRVGVIPALLDAGIRVSGDDHTRTNSLHVAVSGGDHSLVRLPLEKDKSAVDAPNGEVVEFMAGGRSRPRILCILESFHDNSI